MTPELLGLHHVTAVTAHAHENHQFCITRTGLRVSGTEALRSWLARYAA